MTTRDLHATTAGVLLITATVVSLVSTSFLGSLPDGADFLTDVSQHQERLLTAGLFQLLAAFTSANIAITLYPVLRQPPPGLGLGGLPADRGTFYAVSAVGTPVLVSLSDEMAPGTAVAIQASGVLV